MNKWKKTLVKIRFKNAMNDARDAGEAKRLGVEIRSKISSDSGHLELNDMSSEAAANSVLTKNYFGEHALILLCQHRAVTAAHILNYLSVQGGTDMAKVNLEEGDFPLHKLCKNNMDPRVLAECIEAFLSRVPDAAKWRGKWGMLPMHSLCSNPSISGAAVRCLYKCNPGSVEQADGRRHSPIHHLCQLEHCSRQPEALKALLKCNSALGTQSLHGAERRPIDLLARNTRAPVESFEVLLYACPQALDHLKRDAAKGLRDPYLDRIRAVLSTMEGRRRERLKLPPVSSLSPSANPSLQRGPNQHVNKGSGNSRLLWPKKSSDPNQPGYVPPPKPDPRIRRGYASPGSPLQPHQSAAAPLASSASPPTHRETSSFLPSLAAPTQHSQGQRQKAGRTGGSGSAEHSAAHPPSDLLKERWGLGVVDEGAPAMPRAIASRDLHAERRIRGIMAGETPVGGVARSGRAHGHERASSSVRRPAARPRGRQ